MKDVILSLKDNLGAIKEGISAEEQFLESVIKAEGFWKKYKKIIIALALALVLFLIGKTIINYMNEQNIKSSNIAYSKLLVNKNDKESLEVLKSKNPKLYELYIFQNKIQSNDPKSIENLSKELNDPILKELASFQASSTKKSFLLNAQITSDLKHLEEGYLLLKQNKIEKAKKEFAKISKESQVYEISNRLNHYLGK